MTESLRREDEAEGAASTVLRWIGGRLVAAFVIARIRLWARMAAATLVIALIAGMAAFLHAVWTDADSEMQVRRAMGAAILAAVASMVTGLGLYPVLRQRDGLLLRAALAIISSNFELLAVLGKLTELRGGDTAGHNLRVTCHALLFVEALKLPPENVVRAVKGALLHDVGKLVVPDSVLGKPGPLTVDERAEMATHVVRGVEVVRQSRFLAEAVPIVAAHHEHFDGSGYPNGLAGEEIPREARMFALIDVFDALTSPRVYKPAQSVTDALNTMAAGRGTHFDPELFDRFAEYAPELVKQVPIGEKAQTALLMQRMRPYMDRAFLGQALPPGRHMGHSPSPGEGAP